MQEIKSMEDLVKYCLIYKDSIYIRTRVNDHWVAITLADIPGTDLLNYLLIWWNERKTPHRVKARDLENFVLGGEENGKSI